MTIWAEPARPAMPTVAYFLADMMACQEMVAAREGVSDPTSSAPALNVFSAWAAQVGDFPARWDTHLRPSAAAGWPIWRAGRAARQYDHGRYSDNQTCHNLQSKYSQACKGIREFEVLGGPLTMMALEEANMSPSAMFDRSMLETAISEIDVVKKSLPKTTLNALAVEVVGRVANNLRFEVAPDHMPTADEIDSLCNALVSDDAHAAASFIEQAQARGSSYESLCLLYLSAAARRLGEWWDNDRVTFYRVTVAAGRIYAILRILRRQRPFGAPSLKRAATFASVPGENHTLGITMARDLARERGWDIELLLGLDHEALVNRLEHSQPRVIGLSASGKRSLPALTRLIVALRIGTPNARIVVCGQIAATNLALVGVTGADAATADFNAALRHMERFVSHPALQMN